MGDYEKGVQHGIEISQEILYKALHKINVDESIDNSKKAEANIFMCELLIQLIKKKGEIYEDR